MRAHIKTNNRTKLLLFFQTTKLFDKKVQYLCNFQSKCYKNSLFVCQNASKISIIHIFCKILQLFG